MKDMLKSNISISSLDRNASIVLSSKKYSLNTNDVVIYTIYLPDFIDLKSDLVKFLNLGELNRSERFHKEKDRNRFIICRSILKFILAAYTKWDLSDIILEDQLNKKPYLAGHTGLHFNISHSEDYALIAISQKKVGIDIEYISEDFNFTSLLPDIFVDTEILEIQNAVDKPHAFFTSWTRKEALVKALGKGIDEDFKRIPCLNGQHTVDATLLKTNENWQVYSFDVADHYLGAVAFESISVIAKNLEIYTVPNTMKGLLEMT